MLKVRRLSSFFSTTTPTPSRRRVVIFSTTTQGIRLRRRVDVFRRRRTLLQFLHFGTGAELSGHFGTSAEVSYGHVESNVDCVELCGLSWRRRRNLLFQIWFTLWFTLCRLNGRRCNQQGLGLSGLVHEKAHPVVPDIAQSRLEYLVQQIPLVNDVVWKIIFGNIPSAPGLNQFACMTPSTFTVRIQNCDE